MKKFKYNLLLLSIPIVFTACNNGSSNNTNETMDGVEVQSVSPPNGATNIGLGEVIILHLNKNLSPNTIKQYVTLSNQTNSNSSLTVNVTGKNGVYEITPQIGLQPNTTYNFTIQLPESNTQTSKVASNNSNTYTMTTQPAYKIFLTAQSVKGNLGNPNTGQNSKEWADHICNTDNHRPDNSLYYKAMMGIQELRYACSDNGYCGVGHNLDWVLQPSTSYYNTNNEIITTSNIFSTFTFPTTNVINDIDAKVWTGLDKSWANSSHCNNWTSGSSSKEGRVGWSNKSDERMIYYDKHDCDRVRTLYCVQQPQAIISSPALSPINQYLITDANSPITVTFNSINPINPSTVTTNTFTVTSSTTGLVIPGNITNNGSNSFTFTPSNSYAPANQYIISLTNNILDNQGLAITPTTLFFNTAAQTKLIYMTTDSYWGNVGGISGADSKCQADTQCPTGKNCKAILMDTQDRYACTAIGVCGGVNSKDWVLAPSTTYINTKGQIISTTNSSSIFGNGGQFVFDNPINDTGGKAWTGFDNNFMIKYKDGSPVTCSQWSIGDSGINALGGLYGNAASIYPYAFTQDGGGCSKYTNKIDYGVYVDKQCNASGGCSTRHLYCAEQ